MSSSTSLTAAAALAPQQQLIPLGQAGARLLRVGSPLPFNIRNARGELILPRGRPVSDAGMLASLLRPGVGIAPDELREAQARSGGALTSGEEFFERWQALLNRLGIVLRSPEDRAFLPRLRECAAMVAGLSESNADRLIFAVMRHDHSRYAAYGSVHALHVAAVSLLLAQRQGWSENRQRSLIGAALTMNLSIIELQGQLATRGGPLSAAQRKAVDLHPRDSARLLRQAGVDDMEWLLAVEQHHEQAGGGGYPAGLDEPCEMAQLLHFVDIFLAKHAGRAGRSPLPAQQAARELYTASGGHPVAALLIKEFGVFPPGCFVRLANGETAIVVKRSRHASQPLACAISKRNGEALGALQARDTSQPEYAIVATLLDKDVRVPVPAESLYRVVVG